tara:strand:- start:275 stop:664 length:390 start_codon:yes stop_codon:yes gene_type:complete
MKKPITKNRIVTFIDPESNRKWNVRLLIEGDKYGLNDCLTYGDKEEPEEEPCVEFYDAHNNKEETFSPWGQFVSRYYLSTMNEREENEGLNLCGYEPVWSVSGDFMDAVMAEINKINDAIENGFNTLTA